MHAGPFLDGESVYSLLEAQRCNFAAAVPTVFLGLLQYMREAGRKLHHLRIANIGGAACPMSLTQACSSACRCVPQAPPCWRMQCMRMSHEQLSCTQLRARSARVVLSWQALQEEHGVEVRHMWGMTELTPIGTLGGFKVSSCSATRAQLQRAVHATQYSNMQHR